MTTKVKQSGSTLRIELQLEKPTPSKSGKTMLVASTHGVKSTDVRYEGKQIVVVANAFIYPKESRRRSSNFALKLGVR